MFTNETRATGTAAAELRATDSEDNPTSGKPLMDVNRRQERQMERLRSSKLAYALFGALGGIVLGVLALIQSSVDSGQTYPGTRGALWLAAGGLFGLIVGLELHSSRTWRRFGKYTFAIRFILACSAGGTGIGLGGMFLGTAMKGDLWKYSAGGALVGLLLLVWVKLERLGD